MDGPKLNQLAGFSFLLFCFTHLLDLLVFCCLVLERRVTISKGKKETKKERENYFDRVWSVFSSFI